jgi:hypothetical protein
MSKSSRGSVGNHAGVGRRRTPAEKLHSNRILLPQSTAVDLKTWAGLATKPPSEVASNIFRRGHFQVIATPELPKSVLRRLQVRWSDS